MIRRKAAPMTFSCTYGKYRSKYYKYIIHAYFYGASVNNLKSRYACYVGNRRVKHFVKILKNFEGWSNGYSYHS